jgi:hypothetical protein
MKIRASEEVKFGAVILLLCVFLGFQKLRATWPEQRFRLQWTLQFRSCQSFGDVKKLKNPAGGRILSRQFNDGSWVALAWHNPHPKPMGLSWEAALFRDSTGKTVWASHKHFCDERRLDADFYNPKIRTLQMFWKLGPLNERLGG